MNVLRISWTSFHALKAIFYPQRTSSRKLIMNRIMIRMARIINIFHEPQSAVRCTNARVRWTLFIEHCWISRTHSGPEFQAHRSNRPDIFVLHTNQLANFNMYQPFIRLESKVLMPEHAGTLLLYDSHNNSIVNMPQCALRVLITWTTQKLF